MFWLQFNPTIGCFWIPLSNSLSWIPLLNSPFQLLLTYHYINTTLIPPVTECPRIFFLILFFKMRHHWYNSSDFLLLNYIWSKWDHSFHVRLSFLSPSLIPQASTKVKWNNVIFMMLTNSHETLAENSIEVLNNQLLIFNVTL